MKSPKHWAGTIFCGLLSSSLTCSARCCTALAIQATEAVKLILGIGEPLINQELPRMIEYLKARGVTVLFNTNATLLNEAWSRKLIASGLDEMRCSLDGADPQTYAAIRGAPLLHKIVQNLR